MCVDVCVIANVCVDVRGRVCVCSALLISSVRCGRIDVCVKGGAGMERTITLEAHDDVTPQIPERRHPL